MLWLKHFIRCIDRHLYSERFQSKHTKCLIVPLAIVIMHSPMRLTLSTASSEDCQSHGQHTNNVRFALLLRGLSDSWSVLGRWTAVFWFCAHTAVSISQEKKSTQCIVALKLIMYFCIVSQVKNHMCVWCAAKVSAHRAHWTHIDASTVVRSRTNVKCVASVSLPARISTIIVWHILR